MAREQRPAQPPDHGAPPNFEDAIERLETIVEELEGGALSLEESILRYEEGMKLSRQLTRTLDDAEKRIERLTETGGPDGTPGTRPMELDPADAQREEPGEGKLPF
jgi:exodeoxyribonuclease VII small subunit